MYQGDGESWSYPERRGMACSGSQAWTCHELAYPCLSRAIEATKPFFVYTVAFMIAVALSREIEMDNTYSYS